MSITDEQLLSEFRSTASDVLAVADSDLSLDATMAELDADSLDLIELVRTLEDRHGITIDDSELAQITTLRDAYNLLRAKCTVTAT